jgi:hypothetical protein
MKRAGNAETPTAQLFRGGRLDILKRQQTSASSLRFSSGSIAGAQDEGAVTASSATARHEQSSRLCTIGLKMPIPMRPFDDCGVAHALHQWHENRHMDSQPKDAAATAVAVCGRSSVGAAQERQMGCNRRLTNV